MNASTRLLITSSLASACLVVCGLAQAQAVSSGTSSTTTGAGSQSYGTSSNVGSSLNTPSADSANSAVNSGGMSGNLQGSSSSNVGGSTALPQGGVTNSQSWSSSNTDPVRTAPAGTVSSSSLQGTTGAPSQDAAATYDAPSSSGSNMAASSGSNLSDTSTPLAYDPPAAGPSSSSSYSWLPYTTRGYVGINVGRAKFDDLECVGGLECDDSSSRAFKVYTGGMFNDNFGLELAYLNTGSVDRNGGDTKGWGVNLSLLGQAPLGDMAAFFGKVGATYSRTDSDASALALAAGAEDGKDSGFGLSYGIGLRLNFTPNWAAVVEIERHKFHFADDEKDNVTFTTIGVQYRF